MSIHRFFTLIWMLYLPTCIAFYHILDFQFVDEFLTLCLLLFAIYKIDNYEFFRNREIGCFLLVAMFYLIYSAILRKTTMFAILYDFQQQVRPYVVFYCTAILAPRLRNLEKKLVIIALIISLILYFASCIYLNGLLALETSTTAVVCNVGGLLFLFYMDDSKINRYYSVCIIALGFFSWKSKFFAEFISFVAIVFFMKKKIKKLSFKTLLIISFLGTIILYFTWTKFNMYYIEGFKGNGEMLARPVTYMTSLKIIMDYLPFGSGLGTFATNAARVVYSPLYYEYNINNVYGLSEKYSSFMCDAYYPSLAQFGLFGIFLFFLFWKRRFMEVRRIRKFRNYKVGLLAVIALLFEGIADSTYLSGFGMGYFILLGTVVGVNSKKFYRRWLLFKK